MIEFNVLNFIFITFIIAIVIMGGLINLIEPYLPTMLKQFFRYGKASYKGEKSSLVELVEIPKSYFKHFYVFAFIWSWIGFSLALKVYVIDSKPPMVIVQFLDLITGSRERPVQVGSTAALISVGLFTLQSCRRFYETQFVQIFSSRSKINLSHYFVGYFHYFGAVTAILANAQGFVTGSLPQPPALSDVNIIQWSCISLFLYSWIQQFCANLTLVNLRKNKSGKIVTEKHLLPEGGWFTSVSSPHMLFEIAMYVALLGLMPNSVTWRYVVVWVFVNQTETAWLNHKWYKETFSSKYPKERKAILPGIL